MATRGSVRQRSSGSFTIQVSGGFDAGGRRVRITRTVRGSERDAQRELTKILRDVDRGEVADPGRLTLARYLTERWLPHAATRVRPNTHGRYESLMRIHVTSRIGNVKLAKLRPMHVQQVLDGMLEGGAAPRSAVQAYRVLSAALRQAVRWQLVAVNPAAAVAPPRPERPELQVPEPESVRRLLGEAEGGVMYVPLFVAATTGMRRGEVLGLRWSAVDLEAGVVRVTSTLQRVGGELVFVSPKTDRARRQISLPPVAVEVLRRQRKDQAERRLLLGEAWKDAGVVVDRGDGRPLAPEHFSHAFGRFARRANLPGIRLHDLRHAFATTLLEAGVHPKIASEALGHASVAFTMDTYQHLMPSMGEQAARAIQAALGEA